MSCTACAFLWLTDFTGQTFYDRNEFADLDRFGDVSVISGGDGANPILGSRVSSQRDRRNVFCLTGFLRAHLLDQAVTVDAGHADVADDQIEMSLAKFVECFRRRGDTRDLRAVLPQID